MAVITIPHNPELTREQVQAIFERHFAGKYRIERTHAVMRDFQVYKNPFVAVTVKLVQTGTETKFTYSGYTPRVWARLIMGGLLGFIFFWKGITHEVEQLIKTAPEFQKSPTMTRIAA